MRYDGFGDLVGELSSLWSEVIACSGASGSWVHGYEHWRRVERNGLFLLDRLGPARADADAVVVSLFALFHDSMRENDYDDPGHGRRGAALARSMRDRLEFLTDDRLDLLTYACEWHTDRTHDDDPTVAVCWDADRLDLGRVGIEPDPAFLNTRAARSVIEDDGWDGLWSSPGREF